MLVTVHWINDYLQEKISAKELSDLLTGAGFPLEGSEELPNGDVRQDFEMTSNRGDCTCHVGLAREIAASSKNILIEPDCNCVETGPDIAGITSVNNEEPDLCPLYTARVIQGVSVKDSPEWLSTKIQSRGDTPRNAVVDATNFVLFELGQPTHVFDLDKLEGGKIIVRMAKDGEEFLPLGEDATPIKLSSSDLVIADAKKPVALAGIKGGAASAVTSETINILIEAATFDPVTVRNSSRRHKISSDSSFRFERGVSPLQIEQAANRLAGLLIEVAGGELCSGTLNSGKPLPSQLTVTMRTDKCRERLGVDIEDTAMMTYLESLGFSSTNGDGEISCEVPFFRGDITREVDLIEEVGRVFGYANFPVNEDLEIRVPKFGGESDARSAILNALAGMGFVECTTHSLISMNAANAFLKTGQQPLHLEDDRASAYPTLRPSIVPSLLTVRKYNADNGVNNLKLAELGSVFTLTGDTHQETTELALVIDANDDEGIGVIRGVVDRVCEVLTSSGSVHIEQADETPWLEPGGKLMLNGQCIGYVGRLHCALQKTWGLPSCVHVAQLHLSPLLAAYPPDITSTPLPTQPSIERDLSLIIDETMSWNEVEKTIASLSLDHLEAISFVTTFKGKKIGNGKKSLTLRLRFRDKSKTLTHEEVNEQVESATNALIKNCNAEFRS